MGIIGNGIMGGIAIGGSIAIGNEFAGIADANGVANEFAMPAFAALLLAFARGITTATS